MSEIFKEPARMVVPATLIGGSIGLFAAIRSLENVPPWIQKLIETQGSDFIVAFTVLGAVIYFSPRLIKALTDQAVALSIIAESMRGLPQKDHMKFEEILIGQEMLHRSLDRVHARLDALVKDGNG